METSTRNNKVRSIIELFESRCKKENAIRLNKPLSKSFSALSHSEKKFVSNYYGSRDSIYKVEDKLASYTSRIKSYRIYSKETHIKHLQELLQILITLVNIDTDRSEAIVVKKKEIVNCINARFEELNDKLPSTLSNGNFDLTYKPYLSLTSPHFQDFENEETESTIAVVGSTIGSVEQLESSSCNSLNGNEGRKSPNIIVENGSILGSVEKLKAIFSNNEITRKQQVTENYSLKTSADNELNICDSVEKNTVFDNYQTIENENSITVVHELTDTEYRAHEYEDSYFTDDSSSHKNFDAGNYQYDTVQDEAEELSDEETSGTDEVCLSSRNLNEISRNKHGMQNVSSLKRIFENKDTQGTLDDQKSIEDEVRHLESRVVNVELLENSELSICVNKEGNEASDNRKGLLEDAGESLEDTLIELGGDLEECNITVVRVHPEDESTHSAGSSTINDKEACIIS